jgi:prevent-host-death family protein
MPRVNIVELRNHLAETLNRARFGRERIVVARRGRILGAIVPPEDLEFLLSNHALDRQQLAVRAAGDLRNLGFLPPPGLFAIEIGMDWHPEEGCSRSLGDGPDPCDPLL